MKKNRSIVLVLILALLLSTFALDMTATVSAADFYAYTPSGAFNNATDAMWTDVIKEGATTAVYETDPVNLPEGTIAGRSLHVETPGTGSAAYPAIHFIPSTGGYSGTANRPLWTSGEFVNAKGIRIWAKRGSSNVQPISIVLAKSGSNNATVGSNAKMYKYLLSNVSQQGAWYDIPFSDFLNFNSEAYDPAVDGIPNSIGFKSNQTSVGMNWYFADLQLICTVTEYIPSVLINNASQTFLDGNMIIGGTGAVTLTHDTGVFPADPAKTTAGTDHSIHAVSVGASSYPGFSLNATKYGTSGDIGVSRGLLWSEDDFRGATGIRIWLKRGASGTQPINIHIAKYATDITNQVSFNDNSKYYSKKMSSVSTAGAYYDILFSEFVRGSDGTPYDAMELGSPSHLVFKSDNTSSNSKPMDYWIADIQLIRTKQAPEPGREPPIEWLDYDPEPGAFSMAVIPDTQVVSDYWPTWLPRLYNWLADNAETENLQYVMGLGDITNHNYVREWEAAVTAHGVLDNAGIPYSLVPGNHDYAQTGYRNLDLMNTYFPLSNYESLPTYGGAFEAGRIENTYHKFTVMGHNYLILALEFGPRDSVLEWANGICEANPDYKVIVTTHAYMDKDGTRLAKGETHASTGYKFITDANDPLSDPPNDGEDMWDKLISQQENIIMTFSGHVGDDDITERTDIGIHGNIVKQYLIDAQSLDNEFKGVLAVAMLRFSADGEVMRVNYYSILKEKFINSHNQFTVDLSGAHPAVSVNASVVMDGGTILVNQNIKYNQIEAAISAATGYTKTLLKSGHTVIDLTTTVETGAGLRLKNNKNRYAEYSVLTNPLQPGDVSGSGAVDVADIVLQKRSIIGIEILGQFPKMAGDIDNDGEITASDITALKRMLLNLNNEPAA